MRRVDPKHYTKDYYLNDCTGFNEFKKSWGDELEPRLRVVSEKIPLKSKMRVLDIGSGRGELSFWMAKKGVNVVGIDYSKDAIELANLALSKKPQEIQKRIKFYVKDAKKLDFPQSFFDGVILTEVWEHLYPEEQEKVLIEISKVLKKDGFILIHTAPSRWFNDYTYRYFSYPISTLFVFLWNIFKKNKYPNVVYWKELRTQSHKIMHVGEPDYFSLIKIFKKHGFSGSVRSTNITVIKPSLSFKDVIYNFLVYLYPLSIFFPFNILWGNDFLGVFRKTDEKC